MLGRLSTSVNSTRANSQPRKMQCTRVGLLKMLVPVERGDQTIASNYGLGFKSAVFRAGGLGAADFLGDQNSGSPLAKSLETCDVSGLWAYRLLSVER